MAADRQITVWDVCKVCARQMVGGPPGYEHNPTPEMRAEWEKGEGLASSIGSVIRE